MKHHEMGNAKKPRKPNLLFKKVTARAQSYYQKGNAGITWKQAMDKAWADYRASK